MTDCIKHLCYSFAGVNDTGDTITTNNPNDKENWKKLTALKKKKPPLKTYIAIGGYGIRGKVFSDMVSSNETRKAFIDSAISMMTQYGFDGIDIDREYPAASDRNGTAADTMNFVAFLSEFRAAANTTFALTSTLPASFWYLKGFDIANMAKYVDWFNFMSYDLHKTWDGQNAGSSPVVNPHTNLTEISAGLDLLRRNNVPPSKVLLGLAFYGRSFTLANSSCTVPGCPFGTKNGARGGVAGESTDTNGILSDYEINRIILNNSITLHHDKTAAVNWISWNSNQWHA